MASLQAARERTVFCSQYRGRSAQMFLWQGPKPKGKKGGKAGKGKPGSAGGEEDNIASDDLKGMIRDMTLSRAKEQEERNYFQLERDKINTFWGACFGEIVTRLCDPPYRAHR